VKVDMTDTQGDEQMTRTDTFEQAEELAHRRNHGIEVSLLWSKAKAELTVTVTDERTGEAFELRAHPENALDVFNHPYAYAAHLGVHLYDEAALAA
jgi:hypothetical protein